MENIQEEIIEQSGFLAKPELIEDKKSWMRKTLFNLAIYIFIFLVILKIELIYGAALLIVLLIHELGHFLAMKYFNYSNPKLFTLPLLGSFNAGKENSTITQRQMSTIILAGPLPGIIIGMAMLITNNYYPSERLEMLGNIFVGLNFFNLLPFMPLDGGRLLETLFVNQNYVLRLVFTIISIAFLVLLAIQLRNIFFLIIPATMVLELISETKNQRIRDYLLQERINYNVDYKKLPDKDYWFIRDCILLSFNKRYAMVPAGEHKYTIIENSLMQHVIAIIRTPVIGDLKVIGKFLMLMVLIAFLIIPVMYYIPQAIELINTSHSLTK